MKKLTRDRVVPTISASVSRLIIGLGPRFFARRTVNTLTPGTKDQTDKSNEKHYETERALVKTP